MGLDSLKVFISGNETELKNERASVKLLVECLGLEPVSSESRPASSIPIRKKYPPEVVGSDIYIGIFGKLESNDSINEYNIAYNNGKERLIFVKKVKGKRKTKIIRFLEKIMNPVNGVYYREFDDVTDLDVEVHKALIST